MVRPSTGEDHMSIGPSRPRTAVPHRSGASAADSRQLEPGVPEVLILLEQLDDVAVEAETGRQSQPLHLRAGGLRWREKRPAGTTPDRPGPRATITRVWAGSRRCGASVPPAGWAGPTPAGCLLSILVVRASCGVSWACSHSSLLGVEVPTSGASAFRSRPRPTLRHAVGSRKRGLESFGAPARRSNGRFGRPDTERDQPARPAALLLTPFAQRRDDTLNLPITNAKEGLFRVFTRQEFAYLSSMSNSHRPQPKPSRRAQDSPTQARAAKQGRPGQMPGRPSPRYPPSSGRTYP
jgi:hypothetical protein